MKANPSISWREVSEIPRVAPAEIQVWRVNLLASTGEISRLRNFCQPKSKDRQRNFISSTTKGGSSFAARSCGNCYLPTWVFIRRKYRLPVTDFKTANRRRAKPMQLRFNSSHSSDWALIALAQNCESGVDVEQHRHLPDRDELANNFFSEPEIRELNRLLEPARTAGSSTAGRARRLLSKPSAKDWLSRSTVFRFAAPEQSAAIFEIAGDDSTAHKKWSVTSINSIAGFLRLWFFKWAVIARAFGLAICKLNDSHI